MKNNNKGFTLMELVAAIFIGGMVTAALVLVWKTASLQTSQGQRQTIVRNQISNFQRQLYRDFYSADIITWPNADNNGSEVILAGLQKAKQVSNTHFEPFLNAHPKGPTKFFIYCRQANGREIKRYEEEVGRATTGEIIKELSAYSSNYSNTCWANGKTVLTDFIFESASITDGYKYNLKGTVEKTFENRRDITPIYIVIDETLLKQGGF